MQPISIDKIRKLLNLFRLNSLKEQKVLLLPLFKIISYL